MTLQCELDGIKAQLLAVLGPEDRQALEDAIERLRMLQLVEQGLGVGDVLPDFILPDIGGRVLASEGLLAKGPLAVMFFRGPWCPYCSLTLQALDEARPRSRRWAALSSPSRPFQPWIFAGWLKSEGCD